MIPANNQTTCKRKEFNMSDIIWPEGFVPGFTDNFCSNEVIVADLSTQTFGHS